METIEVISTWDKKKDLQDWKAEMAMKYVGVFEHKGVLCKAWKAEMSMPTDDTFKQRLSLCSIFTDWGVSYDFLKNDPELKNLN